MLYTSTLSEVSNNINTGVEYEIALIEELKNKLRECKDAGIQFIYNSDEWTFGAFNKTECDNFQSDWDSDNHSSDEYYIEMGEEPENLGEIFPTSLNVNCETKIYIKFKD